MLLYRPFDAWFEQGYNALELWKGEQTGLSSYLVHWGLFLFVIAAWLFDETVDWMAHTPLSALQQAAPATARWLIAALVALVGAAGACWCRGVAIALVVGAAGRAGRRCCSSAPDQPEAKRVVLFMIGTALAADPGGGAGGGQGRYRRG